MVGLLWSCGSPRTSIITHTNFLNIHSPPHYVNHHSPTLKLLLEWVITYHTLYFFRINYCEELSLTLRLV